MSLAPGEGGGGTLLHKLFGVCRCEGNGFQTVLLVGLGMENRVVWYRIGHHLPGNLSVV